MRSSTLARSAGWGAVLLLLGAVVLPAVFAAPALAGPEAEVRECPKFPWAGECSPKKCYTCECRPPFKAKCPPKYENLRFEENWDGCLCVPCCDREDWTDFLKARRLCATSFWNVSVGGQLRFRYEAWSHQLFRDTPAADDAWGLFRARAHADIRYKKLFRFFVEGIYADEYDRELGPRGIDQNRGDLLNAFLQFGGCIAGYDAFIRFGRTELLEGKQRLVSPLDWANTRRTFDGVFARVAKRHHRIDLWATQPVQILPTEFDEVNDDVGFWGAYYTNRKLTCLTWELYLMGLHREPGTYLGVTEDEDRVTIGGRAGGEIPNTRFYYDVEAAGQFGTFGDQDIAAGMVSANIGWAPQFARWENFFELGFDYASGDGDGAEQGTFNQLFPLGHAYFGYADLIARQNIVAGRVTWKVKPTKSTTLRADYHMFNRASEFDGVYNAGGVMYRAPVAGVDDMWIGNELDLSAMWNINRHWRASLGWAHFFAGDFIEATGASEDVDFVWLELQWTF